MSPEQALGESGVDRRSDIYALGCVLFEMLSGIVPHGERGSDRILVRRITDPAPSLAALCPVPQVVDDALTRAPRALGRRPLRQRDGIRDGTRASR
jgi:serine/threonine-protein kinase